MVKNTKNEHYYWILHIRISLGTNFQLKLTIAIFWTKFAKKRSYFQSKINKIDITTEFCIFKLVFHQVSLWTNNFKFFDQICPRKIFMVKNRKVEHHHHQILLIQIGLSTEFQFKLTILSFLTGFNQKEFSWSKTERVNTAYFLDNSAYSN